MAQKASHCIEIEYRVDTKRFWRMFTFRIVGILDFVHRLIFSKAKRARNTTFRKLNLLPSSGESKDGEGRVQ